MNFNFGEVLTRAWQIIWKHKILWIFGIFAACSRGNGGGSGGQGIRGGGGNGPGQNPFPQLQQTFEQLGQWIGDNPWIIVVFVVVVIGLVLLSLFLGTIGRIGLIRGTYQAEQGTERLIFGELFSGSMPYFWRVLGLSLLIALISLLIFIPLILFGVFTAGVGFICILPLICVLAVVLWGVSIVLEQANAAIVIENLSIGDGLRKGWEVVRANIGPVIILALILLVGAGVIGFIFALPIVIAVFPFIFGVASNSTSPIWIAVACCALYFPVLLILNGILTSYVQTVWALTYMRLTRPPETAPVVLEANA